MAHQKGVCLTGKTGEKATIPWWSHISEPALFPLLFPFGQTGYSQSLPLVRDGKEEAIPIGASREEVVAIGGIL